ncbi:hypothetical protein BGZ60DRAFT_509545 [Tricladium varicosporioides]|nr:hypothetical protein BGZ60DRAFT_509545 [Hymenoscyphus varicosporioides]
MGIHEDASTGRLTRSVLDQYRTSPSFDIDATDTRGLTPLATAALKGQTNVVKTLLENGADANKLSRGDRSALWFATAGSMHRRDRSEIVRLLLDKGADIDKPSPVNSNYTPLMKVIVEWKDPEIIRQLVDANASLTIKNDNQDTARDLAERNKDPAVLRALLPKNEREASRADFISLIVKFVLFVVAWINGSDTSSIAQGIVSDIYKISGQREPEIEKDIPEAQTVEEYKNNLDNYVANTGMDDFFKKGDPFLQTLCEKAAKLKKNPKTSLKSDDNIRDLTRLSLYQPVIYCDDSSSMADRDGREESQRQLVKRITRIATYIVPDKDGVELCFINSPEKGNSLKENDVEQIFARVKPRGATELGTNLVEKILKPMVYDKLDRNEQLKRPILICIITDGVPGGFQGSPERPDTFKNALIECQKRLVDAGYEPGAVLFQISQIGTDERSKTFLDGLKKEKLLERTLYCTSGRLDQQYEALKENEEDLEQWLLKTLTGPIMDRDVV